MVRMLIRGDTTLVGLHVTKHRCNLITALDALAAVVYLLCINQHTTCTKGTASYEHLALLQ